MELALDTEQEKQRQMQMKRYQAQSGPLAMPQEGPSMMQQAKDYAVHRKL